MKFEFIGLKDLVIVLLGIGLTMDIIVGAVFFISSKGDVALGLSMMSFGLVSLRSIIFNS